MAKPYFSQVPNLDYVDRTPGEKTISAYKTVKNLFKRAKLREDIFSDLTYFTKYQVVGDERPDNVAEKFYDDPTLDWVILLANNITNIQTEWPMSENSFNNFLIDKYGSQVGISSTHHYECTGVKDTLGVVIAPEGLTIDKDFTVTYYDKLASAGIVTATNLAETITNYDYESKLQNEKRNIFVLKPEYISVIFNDLEDIMEYKKGSTQYRSGTLKVADNIRLYPN
jgi:hypothetical protein